MTTWQDQIWKPTTKDQGTVLLNLNSYSTNVSFPPYCHESGWKMTSPMPTFQQKSHGKSSVMRSYGRRLIHIDHWRSGRRRRKGRRPPSPPRRVIYTSDGGEWSRRHNWQSSNESATRPAQCAYNSSARRELSLRRNVSLKYSISSTYSINLFNITSFITRTRTFSCKHVSSDVK